MSERIFGNACTALEYLHESLCTREKKNAKLLVSRGALPASVQAAYEEQKQQCEPGRSQRQYTAFMPHESSSSASKGPRKIF